MQVLRRAVILQLEAGTDGFSRVYYKLLALSVCSLDDYVWIDHVSFLVCE